MTDKNAKSGTALITGGSSGMGYEFARILASRGFHLVLVSNEEEKLENIGKDLQEKFNVQARTFFMDLARPEAANELYNKCHDHNIQIDILINNAGIFFFSEVVETTVEKALNKMTLHMITPSLLCLLFGADMKKRRRGYILNVSSIAAYMPYPGIAFYGSTKRYLKSFSRAFRTEMTDYNVSVTALCPGAVATNLFDRNVIDYKKAMRYGIMMRADKVAEIGINAMFRRRSVIIPGLMNHIFTFLVRITPQGIVLLFRRHTKLLPPDK